MELAGKFQDRADMAIKEIQLSLKKAKTGSREKKLALRPRLLVWGEWAWECCVPGRGSLSTHAPKINITVVFEEGEDDASTENEMWLT